MNNSKSKLSLAGGNREPFGRVTRLEQIPTVLFEILTLAAEIKSPEGQNIRDLVDSVIEVALGDSEAWIKIQDMAADSRQESEFPASDSKDRA